MHGSRAEARRWAESASAAARGAAVDVAVFPPFPYLAEVVAAAAGVGVGAQACHGEAKGAYTGSVSAAMIRDVGATHVLCGHSERRRHCGETDAEVAASAAAAWREGLVPVVCVGETAEERAAGQTMEVVLRQLEAVMAVLPSLEAPLVLAYEPVWAIGSGQAASPAEASAVHGRLRGAVALLDRRRAETLGILYGGSATPANIGGFLAAPHVDGALVGGASLDPIAFAAMVRALPA